MSGKGHLVPKVDKETVERTGNAVPEPYDGDAHKCHKYEPERHHGMDFGGGSESHDETTLENKAARMVAAIRTRNQSCAAASSAYPALPTPPLLSSFAEPLPCSINELGANIWLFS